MSSELMEAIERDSIVDVSILLKKNVNVNYVDPLRNLTPLQLALKNNYAVITELLLEHGADPNAMHVTGNLPLHFCLIFDFAEGIDLLIRFGADVDGKAEGIPKEPPLMMAITQPNETFADAIVEKLINYNADPFCTDWNGETALDKAIWIKDNKRIEQIKEYMENYKKR